MEIINKTHNYSLDFVKGIAACAVVFLHNLPNYYIGSIYWIGQAVPLFLFISAYLTYGSFQKGKTIDNYYSAKSIMKMLNRIFKPFLIMTFIQCLIFYALAPTFSLKGILGSGGIGPGSYYPWIYLQVWIVLPVIILIVDKLKIKYSFILFLMISIIFEVLSNPDHFPLSIYRLSFSRYLFLLYIACIVRKINLTTIKGYVIMLSVISFIYLTLVVYLKIDLRPFIYMTGWESQTYPAFFYAVFIFLILTLLYNKYPLSFLSKLFVRFGNWSYELFLWQIFVYSLITTQRFAFLGSPILKNIAFIATTTILCFVPLWIYKMYLKQYISKIFASKIK